MRENSAASCWYDAAIWNTRNLFFWFFLCIVSLWSSEYILLNLMVVHILGTSENMGIFVESYSCASCNRMYTICSKILTWIRDFWAGFFFCEFRKWKLWVVLFNCQRRASSLPKCPKKPLWHVNGILRAEIYYIT